MLQLICIVDTFTDTSYITFTDTSCIMHNTTHIQGDLVKADSEKHLTPFQIQSPYPCTIVTFYHPVK